MASAFRCILVPIVIAVCFIATAQCARAKTFWGKVIDAETKEPIEGAVVVAAWKEELTTATATHTRVKDVKEVLTNKDGEWSIEGPSGGDIGDTKAITSFLTGKWFLKHPEFIVFKPGYCPCPVVGIEACYKMKPGGLDGDGEILELPKLTNREDRLRALPGPIVGEMPFEKEKEFIRLINEESKNLGLSGTYDWRK